MNNQLSFCYLRSLNVINEVDGKQYGRIIDIIFDGKSACVKGIVVPYNKKCFCKNKDFFIPYNCIKTIGKDVIIVSIGDEKKNNNCLCESECDMNNKCPSNDRVDNNPPCQIISADNCDHRCDKCMLFDCDKRWK